MRSKLVDDRLFSNGSEFMWFLGRNCNWCVKMPHPHARDRRRDTKCRCSIYADILKQLAGGGIKVKNLSVDICKNGKCPYRQEKYPHYTTQKKKTGVDDGLQYSLFTPEDIENK